MYRGDKRLDAGETRKVEGSTKSNRPRKVAIDGRSLGILETQLQAVTDRANSVGESLIDDPYLFTDSLNGSDPWHPDAITRYFGRLRSRLGLKHITVKSLRAFMDTYGQDLGFTLTQVALRAGHDPSVAARHYVGRVDQTDMELARGLSKLLRLAEL